MKKSIVAIIIIVLCLSMSSVFSPKANATSVPNGIVYSIPITLTNTQSMATPTPYQQMISVDSSKYSGYEAPNLKNVEFFDSSGTVIYSWLESGAESSSTNTIYWLNLPNGIAAKSSVTIYLGFASPTTNLLNGQTIGEAPTLSSTYGQYDNGRNVFAFYDNFAGNTLSNLWLDNSAQTKNTFTIDNGITVAPAQAFNNWTSINSVNTFSQGVTEFYGTIPTGDGTATFDGVLVGLICQSGWDSMIGCVAGSYGLITKDGGNWNTAEGLSFGTANIYSLYVPSATSSMRLAEVNYGSTISGNSNPLTLPQPIGLQNQRRSGLTLGPIFWIRERAYPPNGVMPEALVNGQTSSTPQSNSVFSNPLVVAAIIGVILAGIGAAAYYGIIAKGGSAAASAGAKVTGAADSPAGSGTGNLGSPIIDNSNFLDSLFNANTAVGVTNQARDVGEGADSSIRNSGSLSVDDSSFLDSLYNSSTPTSVDPSRAGSADSERVGSVPSSGRVDVRNDYFLNDLRDDRLYLDDDTSPGEIIGTLLQSEGGFACIPFL